MQKLLLIPCLIISICVTAQKKGNPEIFAKTITETNLRNTLTKIASKEMEGRETATPGQKRAAAYIEQRFREMGLKPGFNGSYQMPYPVYQDSVTSASFSVNDKQFVYGKDFSTNISGNNSASYAFSEVVFVGQGRMDSANNDYKNIDVKGKAVLLITPPASNGRAGRMAAFAKINAALKNGAAVALIYTPGNSFTVPSPKGNMYLSRYKKTVGLQQYNVSDAVVSAILNNDFNNINTIEPRVYAANIAIDFNKVTNTLESSNVIGVLEGTDKKDEYLFLTGHYDHLGKRGDVIYYGADDDGSGTTSVIEMAKAFTDAAAKGYRPRRTIVFMTVSGEEKGLWGSQYYSEHPIFPIEKTTADLNTDMVGRVGSDFIGNKDSLNYVYVIGDDKLSSDLPTITNRNNKTNLVLDRRYNDLKDPNRFYYRSDHFNFAKVGIPIVFYFDGVHKDYHQPTDTVDKINFDLMEKRVRYIFTTAWDVANMDRMLKRDIPLPNLN